MNINLHTIFRHLSGDDNLLKTVLNNNINIAVPDSDDVPGTNYMNNVIMQASSLAPYDTQIHSQFPLIMQHTLPYHYLRCGIKNTIDKKFCTVNISFINSLSILLRPELLNSNIDDQINNLNILSTFFTHKISRNYRVDKITNTKKAKEINAELIKYFLNGRITNEIIQYAADIYEVNIVIFDLPNNKNYLFWVHGTKYPHLNLFKKIFCMTHIDGNYEPILSPNQSVEKDDYAYIYTYILSNPDSFNAIPEFKLSIKDLLLINTWNMSVADYIKILNLYFPNLK